MHHHSHEEPTSSKPAPFMSPGKALEHQWTPISCYSQVTAKASARASEASTGEEEYRGIRMKVLCTVGCVSTVAPVPALAHFTEKKSCWVKFFLVKAGAQDGGRAKEHLGG